MPIAGSNFVDALVGLRFTVSEVVDQGKRSLLRDRRQKTQLILPGPDVSETMRFLALLDGAVAGMHFSCSQPTIRWLSSSLAVSIDDGWKVLIRKRAARRAMSTIPTAPAKPTRRAKPSPT